MASQTRPSLTLWNVNVSFNNEPPYYLMSRSDNGVVTREYLVTKLSERRSSAWSLDGQVEVSAERILLDDPYRAYQGVSW